MENNTSYNVQYINDMGGGNVMTAQKRFILLHVDLMPSSSFKLALEINLN